MRILLFNTARRWIGEAASTALLGRELARRGHVVCLAVPRRGKVRDRSRRVPGVEACELPWGMPGEAKLYVGQMLATARLFRRFRPDIIHVGRGVEHWIAALLRPAFAPRAAMVRTRHVVLPLKQNSRNRWLFRKATDAITAVSPAAFASLGELGSHLSPALRRVLHGAVDAGRFSPSRRSDRFRATLGAAAPDTPLVGMMARLQAVKGQDVFLDAMALVAREYPAARFVLAGRRITLANPRLRSWHETSGLGDRVSFIGMVKRTGRLAASIDVGVVASRGSEGFSRAAAEFMLSGVPVVATRVGALPEMIDDGATGLLVPPGDAAALALAVGRLLGDKESRQAIGATAERRAREGDRFGAARLAAEMEAIYFAIPPRHA